MLAGLAVLGTAPARAQPDSTAANGELPEELRTVADVRFRGIDHLGRRPLGGAWLLGRRELVGAGLRTRRPSRLPWREPPALRRDYLRADSALIVQFYRHYGYLDAQVQVKLARSRDPRSAIVEFVVHEGRVSRVGRLDLGGVHDYPVADLRRPLLAQVRRPFDPAFLQIDALKIHTLYQERGYYAHVDTTSRRGIPDSLHVGVRYDVEEGPQYRIGRIEYLGGGRVRPSLGTRELLLRTGDVFRRSRLDQSVERLYGTGLFRQVQVTPEPDSASARMDLLMRVIDRPSRWTDVGVGSGTTQRLRVTAEMGHRNLDTWALAGVLGGELAWYGSPDFRGRLFQDGAASLALTEPWMFGARLQFQPSLFYREQVIRGTWYVQNFDARGWGFTLFRELSRMSRVTLVEENSLVHQGYDVDPQHTGDIADTTLARLKSQVLTRYRANTLRLTAERDMRDDKVTPHRGSYQTLTGELAGGLLKGSSTYTKGVFTSTWYTPIRRGGAQFAARASAGVMRPFGTPASYAIELGVDSLVNQVPLESRFYIGGVNSLRGYGENTVPSTGGLAMALLNLEWRIPLAGPLGVEVFVDAGNVWARPEYIRARDFVAPWQATRVRAGDIRYTYGVGGRLVLPFGPLRIDLAWSDRPDFPRGGRFPGGVHVPFVYQFAIGPTF